ncbi:hypothetical protein Pint_18530 [Pistacia integerrima]|uniref:Uncharacterized protein n=1 Tax=Pistacia integerrima TaxID=434235 RepID=A0ACC0YXF5_9ROSI|nr:hypothetical protein Pint_18530 [Pistacia integerrima]
MGGIVDGFYQDRKRAEGKAGTFKHTTGKRSADPNDKGQHIVFISVSTFYQKICAHKQVTSIFIVNSIGAKVLEFISNFGRPSAPVPTTIVAYVPNKVLVDGFGEIESSSEITDAIKSGLEEPIEAEPELKVPKELISLSELEELKLQHRPSFVPPSRELNFTKCMTKKLGSLNAVFQIQFLLIIYKILKNEAQVGVMRLFVGGG